MKWHKLGFDVPEQTKKQALRKYVKTINAQLEQI